MDEYIVHDTIYLLTAVYKKMIERITSSSQDGSTNNSLFQKNIITHAGTSAC